MHKSSPDDPLDHYYHPIYRLVYRRRLTMALELLGGERFERLLEIGYGSGILLPELSRRARILDAVDLHEERAGVAQMLETLGIQANLRAGDIYDLPYGEGEFNAVVCLSVLEHLTDLDPACAEIGRVLARDGVAVIGFPVANAFTSALFRWLGYEAREIHPSGQAEILPALRRQFDITRIMRLPAVLPLPLGLYVACRCRKL
jgi:2-polyprenyl-3-methyl-5-hydroxy-6-metoxy-1,4-benzoquinol methylase